MSNYEFWDELGKIFNAVMAYQEKTIEFNKRFINPWIRLGNVFDKQDRNKEAVSAYEQAIQLDPGNPQNWYELGNVHFKLESYDAAIGAYKKAIELDPGSGWPYNNLALSFVAQGKHLQAIPLYRKSIDLLEQDRDKAVAWNRLGNLYRKLNEYDLAVEAFQRADDLDQENAGFRDSLEEADAGATGTGNVAPSDAENAYMAASLAVSPIDLILASQPSAQPAAEAVETPGPAVDTSTAIPAQPVGAGEAVTPQPEVTAAAFVAPDTEEQPGPSAGTAPSDEFAAPIGEPPTTGAPEAAQATPVTDEIASPDAQFEDAISVVVPDTIDTLTDTLTETTDAASSTPTADDGEETAVIPEGDAPLGSVAATPVAESTGPAEAAAEQISAEGASLSSGEAEMSSIDAFITAAEEIVAAAQGDGENFTDASQQAAYEQFLQDSRQPVSLVPEEPAEDTVASDSATVVPEPMTKIDAAGEVQIELDSKNSHVWNELGNVYFNTGAYDDAIMAYGKAIELDHWFAWPYSNLALAYVHKGRFAEAILLYQRSIELFKSEKDKAISWNRLGNVYRRLNDYDNAIASYQRADELDPGNTTLSLQSRFSLLGSYTLESKPSYVS